MSDRVREVPIRDVPLVRAEMILERRPDGSLFARHPQPAKPSVRACTVWLDQWAERTPDRILFAQRDGHGPWHTLTYAQVRRASRAIAAGLVARDLSPERPIAILTSNDLGQGLLAFAAQYAGVPFAPISPAYSLLSQDHGKLRYVIDLLRPGLVYVSHGSALSKALAAAVPADTEVVYSVEPPTGRTSMTSLTTLMQSAETPALEIRAAAVGPDTIVKFMFTSGSTGQPKGVINTQGMLTANAEMFSAHMPFVEETPPVLVDWLPWSHTFAGNHNLNLVLRNGGTFYIDEGRPLPGAIDTTVRNLTNVAPTIYFNVPRGFEALLPALRGNVALRKSFFSRLQCMSYAGASLPQHVWEGLEALSVAETGLRVRMLTGYGSTETAPSALGSTARCTRTGMIGVPLPGVTLKLVPNAGKMEARIKGANITPGYWKQPAQTGEMFDADGFYQMGDALKLVDDKDPGLGFFFDGRVAEDFKLTSGTWVSVGPLRSELIQALAPLVKDVVVTGHDRDTIGALLVPEPEQCRIAAGATTLSESVYASPKLYVALKEKLTAHAAKSKGSSTHVARALTLTEPLSLDGGEITDKGSVNQRAVLMRRADLVEALYAATPGPEVIVA